MDSSLSKSEIITCLNSQGDGILNLMIKANENRAHPYITYSKNVFLPLTEVCRNECGYCTFRKDPHDSDTCLLMDPSDVLRTVKKADTYGCKEALFTFGERSDDIPEVKDVLTKIGFETTVEYLYHLSEETLQKTDLLPHSNPGIVTKKELEMLKEVNASMGLMLETTSFRLMENVVHEKSPGKDPDLRIKTIENAGKLKIPFTTGLLIGIGETLEERAESLLELRRIQDKYGHIQEIIIQNFRPKPGIPMENHPEPTLLTMIKTVAMAKVLFPDLSIQVPPNLNPENAQIFLMAGCDDWGGVSPLTKDYVNPEAPWPEIEELEKLTKEAGFPLKERLPVYPHYISSEYLSDRILEKIDKLNFY